MPLVLPTLVAILDGHGQLVALIFDLSVRSLRAALSYLWHHLRLVALGQLYFDDHARDVRRDVLTTVGENENWMTDWVRLRRASHLCRLSSRRAYRLFRRPSSGQSIRDSGTGD